jgi:hypothetical protein
MDGHPPQPSNPIHAHQVVEDLENKLLTPIQEPATDDADSLESDSQAPETPD